MNPAVASWDGEREGGVAPDGVAPVGLAGSTGRTHHWLTSAGSAASLNGERDCWAQGTGSADPRFAQPSTPRADSAQGLRGGLRVHRQCRRAWEGTQNKPGRAVMARGITGRALTRGRTTARRDRSGGSHCRGNRGRTAPPRPRVTRSHRTSGSDSAAGSAASPYRTAQKLVDSLAARTDRVPARRRVRAERDDLEGRQLGLAGDAVELPGRAGDRPRPVPGEGLRELRGGRIARPRRAQQRQPAEPERLRRRRDVQGQRRDELSPHGDLLPARLERLRSRGPQRRSSATGSTTAGDCPPTTTSTGSTSSARTTSASPTTGSTTTRTAACRCSPTRSGRTSRAT